MITCLDVITRRTVPVSLYTDHQTAVKLLSTGKVSGRPNEMDCDHQPWAMRRPRGRSRASIDLGGLSLLLWKCAHISVCNTSNIKIIRLVTQPGETAVRACPKIWSPYNHYFFLYLLDNQNKGCQSHHWDWASVFVQIINFLKYESFERLEYCEDFYAA